MITGTPSHDVVVAVDVNSLLCDDPRNVSPAMLKVLAIIYMISASLSIIGSLSIIVFAVKKKIVFNHEVHPLFNLSLADFFLSCGWFVTTSLWWVRRNQPARKADACFYLEIITQICHIASFFLTVNYAVHVYVRIKQRTMESGGSRGFYHRKMFTGLYSFSWISPFIIMFPMIIYYSRHDFVNCSRCLSLFDRPKARIYNESGFEITNRNNYGWRNYASIALIVTLAFSIFILFVLYFLAMKKFTVMMKRSGYLSIQQRATIESNRKRVISYIAVFIICWFPVFVVAFVDLKTEEDDYDFKKMFVIFLMEGLFTRLQGFFNSFVYGWTRYSFRRVGRLERESSYRRQLLSADGFTSSTYGTNNDRRISY